MCREMELGRWAYYEAAVAGKPMSVFGVVNGARGNVPSSSSPYVSMETSSASDEDLGQCCGTENAEKL